MMYFPFYILLALVTAILFTIFSYENSQVRLVCNVPFS